jgi:hypothetical protein
MVSMSAMEVESLAVELRSVAERLLPPDERSRLDRVIAGLHDPITAKRAGETLKNLTEAAEYAYAALTIRAGQLKERAEKAERARDPETR